MKPKLILLLLLALSAHAFSQSRNTISANYGFAANEVVTYSAMGDFGYKGKGSIQFGIDYTYYVNHKLSLRTGIGFSSDDVELSTVGPNAYTKNGNIKLVTIPIIARRTFVKMLYIEGGLLGDIETNYSYSGADGANHSATRQTGIGLEFGAGIKYNFGPLGIFANPFFQNHALLRFGNSGSTFNLIDGGVRFGAGYTF